MERGTGGLTGRVAQDGHCLCSAPGLEASAPLQSAQVLTRAWSPGGSTLGLVPDHSAISWSRPRISAPGLPPVQRWESS